MAGQQRRWRRAHGDHRSGFAVPHPGQTGLPQAHGRHNTAEFSLQPEGAATRVTWAMYGPNPFIAKLFQVFISMDRMVGGDFEKGLDNLRALAEK